MVCRQFPHWANFAGFDAKLLSRAEKILSDDRPSQTCIFVIHREHASCMLAAMWLSPTVATLKSLVIACGLACLKFARVLLRSWFELPVCYNSAQEQLCQNNNTTIRLSASLLPLYVPNHRFPFAILDSPYHFRPLHHVNSVIAKYPSFSVVSRSNDTFH